MKTIKVKLVNIGPLLMHALPQESESKLRDAGKEFDSEEEAGKGLFLELGDPLFSLISLAFLLELLVFNGIGIEFVFLNGVLNFPGGNLFLIDIPV